MVCLCGHSGAPEDNGGVFHGSWVSKGQSSRRCDGAAHAMPTLIYTLSLCSISIYYMISYLHSVYGSVSSQDVCTLSLSLRIHPLLTLEPVLSLLNPLLCAYIFNIFLLSWRLDPFIIRKCPFFCPYLYIPEIHSVCSSHN